MQQFRNKDCKKFGKVWKHYPIKYQEFEKKYVTKYVISLHQFIIGIQLKIITIFFSSTPLIKFNLKLKQSMFFYLSVLFSIGHLKQFLKCIQYFYIEKRIAAIGNKKNYYILYSIIYRIQNNIPISSPISIYVQKIVGCNSYSQYMYNLIHDGRISNDMEQLPRTIRQLIENIANKNKSLFNMKH